MIFLVAVLVLPALGALLAAAVPARFDRAGRIAGTVFAALAFLVSASMFVVRTAASPIDPPVPAIVPWHEVDLAWAPGLDLRLHLGVLDGVAETRAPELLRLHVERSFVTLEGRVVRAARRRERREHSSNEG